MQTQQRVVIIGGGLGGLAAAIGAAAQGHDTTIVEARPNLGGKLNIHTAAGFTWDIGPSLLTMPWVLDGVLRQAGTTLAAELDVIPLPSACRYLWQDGTQFDAYASMPAMLESIAQIDPRDVGGMMRFLAYSQRMWDITADAFLYTPFAWKNLLDWRMVSQAWQLDSMRSMDAAVRSFFRSPYLRQVMNRFATYNGSSPYRTPATFNVIAWAELGLGAYYPRGGMYRIAEVLEQAARRMGVTIHTNTPVARIHQRQRRVVAVETATGDHIAADAVISNVDPQVTMRTLLGDTQRAAQLRQRELASSGFVVLLGLRRQYAMLDHHTILFSPDYRAEFANTDAGRLHDTPTLYLNQTVGYDSDHAPVGGQNVFILVNVPPLSGTAIDWQQQAPLYTERVIDRLEQFGMHDIRQQIAYQQVLTPRDLQQMYAAPGGSIYGLASNTRLSAFRRPSQRDAMVQGLLYCGGGTHPGGGVPLALLSGNHAAVLLARR